ncbi:MAG: LuxR C-terminal-related transcriptional regulator [Legionella sp.]|uniref:helix-turn-helix transcriptional regulator n=1 Tax=Legionella sp. TaxID=459 RepID=UPI0028482103|nr:LuxR C-terminal-related transcriptional regulator [Legionella sp.]
MAQNLITIDDFYHKPGHCYIKDPKSILLEANEMMALRTNFLSTSEIIGLEDTAIALNPDDAKKWHENDKLALWKGQPQIFVEHMELIDQSSGFSSIQTGLSYKAPYYSRSGKIIGVIGVSFFQEDLKHLESWNDQPLLRSLLLMTAHHFNLFESPQNKSPLSQLSTQQKAIFEFTTQGKTTKEIARLMSLSVRTVEHYIEIIKNKLGCERKKDFYNFLHHPPLRS